MQSAHFPTEREHNSLALSRDKNHSNHLLFSTWMLDYVLLCSSPADQQRQSLLFSSALPADRGPHCSAAFPNLRGIPPAGNMVYKPRHRALQLTENAAFYPSPSWHYLLCDLPFSHSHPSGNIKPVPLSNPPRSQMFWPLDTQRVLCFVTGSCKCWVPQAAYKVPPLHGRTTLWSSIFHTTP